MAVGDTLMNYYKESTTTIATTIFVDVVVAGKSGRCPGAPTRQQATSLAMPNNDHDGFTLKTDSHEPAS